MDFYRACISTNSVNMTYDCSDETLIIDSAVNADKIRLVCNLLNGSKYRETAQQFLNQKNINLQCKYSYAVSNPVTQNPASYVFFATDKINNGYFIKVNCNTNTVTEWYINEQITVLTKKKWFALDLVSNQKTEYYIYETVDGITSENKFNAVTNEKIVTNYFQPFGKMSTEQQALIKDLPFKRTSVCWSNKLDGFTVEFLPSYVDVYAGINMQNLYLLNI